MLLTKDSHGTERIKDPFLKTHTFAVLNQGTMA